MLLVILFGSSLSGFCGETNAVSARQLEVREFLNLVLERNESLQMRLLELKIAQKRLKAEKGAFEPEFLLGYDRVENERENTAEQRRSSGVAVFEEQNNIYTTGVEGLVPTGAKIRLGYTLRDLRNNLQEPTLGTIYTNWPGQEYQTFVGISLTQPLLKNGWFPATMANLRLAGLVGEVAFQEYRRQLMIILTTAEATYWNLFLAQEQVNFFKESVRLAESLVTDTEEKFRAGRGSELEVLEAKSGVALRRTKLAEAEQKYMETATQVASLMSEVVSDQAPVIRAKDAPQSIPAPEFAESGRSAFELNPDYLAQFKKMEQENIRVAYAKNQRLPQLDLKGSYGLNGLGSSPSASLEDVEKAGYPSWSLGAELRVPLAGGIRAKNELASARMRKQQALIMLKEIENQILNSITTALRKLRSAEQTIKSYEEILAFNQNLLETEVKRHQAGKIDGRRLLEVDAALFESKNAVVDAKVQAARARLELELVQGSVLRARSMDLSRKDLEERTLRRLQDAGVAPDAYRQILKGAEESQTPPAFPSTSSSSARTQPTQF